MEARQTRFLDIIGRPQTKFIVPIFQRVYSWNEVPAQVLFDDVLKAGRTDKEHFIGTFLYNKNNNDRMYEEFQIVDGQQRITTVFLMLIALSERLHESGRVLEDGTDSVSIAKEFLFAGEKGASIKLELTSIDGEMLEYLLGASEAPDDLSTQLKANLDLYRSLMASNSFDIDAFWRGLKLISVIEIELDEEDSPQIVFESLNSKGKRLNIEDIVRNAVLAESANATEENVESFSKAWNSFEDMMYAQQDMTIDDAICCWLATQYADVRIKSEDEIVQLFQNMINTRYGGSYFLTLQDLNSFCRGLIENPSIRVQALKDAKRWREGKLDGIISKMHLFGD